MKYLFLICLAIFSICIGAIKAFHSIQRKKTNSKPIDKSFAVHFIMGIPVLIASIYYALTEPSSSLLLVATILISGIIAMLWARRNKI